MNSWEEETIDTLNNNILVAKYKLQNLQMSPKRRGHLERYLQRQMKKLQNLRERESRRIEYANRPLYKRWYYKWRWKWKRKQVKLKKWLAMLAKPEEWAIYPLIIICSLIALIPLGFIWYFFCGGFLLFSDDMGIYEPTIWDYLFIGPLSIILLIYLVGGFILLFKR